MRQNKNVQNLQYIGVCLLFAPLFAFGASVMAQSESPQEPKSVSTKEQKKPLEVTITPKKQFSKNQVKTLLKDEEFVVSNLKSEFEVGNDILTDVVQITPEKNMDSLDKEVEKQRSLLLQNLDTSTKLSESDKKVKEQQNQYSKKDINAARKQNVNRKATFSEVTVLAKDQTQADNIQQKAQSKSYIDQVQQGKPEVEEQPQQEPDQQSHQDSQKQSFLGGVGARITSFFNPIETALASLPSWIPDYTSVAFFDTDETDFYTYDEWDAVAENYGATGYTHESPEIVWHWGRAYIAHTGTDGYTYTGVYGFDQQGKKYWDNYHFNNSNWLKGPKKWDKDPAMVSWKGELYQAVRAAGNNDTLMIRHGPTDSDNYGKPNFGSYQSIQVQTQKDFGMTVHDRQLCVAYQPIGTHNIRWGCSWDGVNFSNWQTMSGLPGGGTDQGVEIESAHGDIYFTYSGRTDDKLYIYDSWNGWRHLMNASTESLPALSKHGDNATGNEKLCLLHRGTDYNGQMWKSCLYRYGDNYDKWNWHPWQRQQGQTNTAPAMAYDDGILGQLHRGVDNKIYLRILRVLNEPTRGYTSYFKWNEKPYGNNTNDAYEHEILLNGEDHGGWDQIYIEGSNTIAGCYPDIRYSASNLPSSYLDTRLEHNGSCDTRGGKPSFTMGTDQADLIEADKYYFTYINGDRGPKPEPNFAVFVQDSVRLLIDGEWGVYQKSGDLSKRVLIDCYQTEPYNQCPREAWTYPYWFQQRWDGGYRFQND